jgi:hypothetical protein
MCAGLLVALVAGMGATPAASAEFSPALKPSEAVGSGGVAARAAVRVVAKADKTEVTEGDRLTVKVKVPKAATARSVTLETMGTNTYGQPAWVKAGKRKASKTTKFTVTVTAENTAKYRALVSYKKATKPVKSNVASVKVWRWISLEEYVAYQSTGGASFDDVSLAGRTYLSWYAYSSAYSSWETRWTAGRNCKAFKGVAGVTDWSVDGSSATVTVLADDVPVYQSPTLTPGMSVPFEVSMASPYRFALLATNTSATGAKVYPAVGDPALLCTGV